MYNSSSTLYSDFLRLQFTDVSKINLETSAFIFYFVIIFQPRYTPQNFIIPLAFIS